MENYNKAMLKNYTVSIDNLVYQKIMHWIDKSTVEVSGLGKLTIDKDTKVIKITSAILIKQENTGSSTELDGASIAKAMYELRNDEGHLNFWWHSHVNMDVFWSVTDLDTIRQIGDQGFVVATVFNKRREMLSAFYRKADEIFPETFLNDLETILIDSSIPQSTIDEWNKDFDEKCKTKSYPVIEQSNAEWYNQYKTYSSIRNDGSDIPNQSFDFDDSGMTNIEAKIYAVKPELDSLKELMLEQETSSTAKSVLAGICRRIENLKLNDIEINKGLKKPYIDAYNKMYPSNKIKLKEKANDTIQK